MLELASAWLSLVVALTLNHLAAELISPLLLQHKVGQKSEKVYPLNQEGITIALDLAIPA